MADWHHSMLLLERRWIDTTFKNIELVCHIDICGYPTTAVLSILVQIAPQSNSPGHKTLALPKDVIKLSSTIVQCPSI